MDENSNSKKSSISQAGSEEEIGDFWDRNSLADHWDQTREVEFELLAQRRRRIAVDPEIYERLEQQARVRGVSLETLVNQWLSEDLSNKAA